MAKSKNNGIGTNQFSFVNDEERFMSYVRVLPSGCWEWAGTIRGGYGRFSTGPRENTKRHQAHRWAYEHWIGDIPPETPDAHHTCHVKGECQEGDDCRHRRCVNPHHVLPSTHQFNMAEGEAGTYQREKTHCPHGHEYTARNTKTVERKGNNGVTYKIRHCRACGNQRTRERYRLKVGRSVIDRRLATHCIKGHPFDEANTVWGKGDKKNRRRCRQCKIDGLRAMRLRQKALQSAA